MPASLFRLQVTKAWCCGKRDKEPPGRQATNQHETATSLKQTAVRLMVGADVAHRAISLKMNLSAMSSHHNTTHPNAPNPLSRAQLAFP